MPGLIWSSRYVASKERLSGQHERFADLIDAAEWHLLLTDSVDVFPRVARTARGDVRAYKITTTPPGVIVVFVAEDHGGDRKALLLDCSVPEPDDSIG